MDKPSPPPLPAEPLQNKMADAELFITCVRSACEIEAPSTAGCGFPQCDCKKFPQAIQDIFQRLDGAWRKPA